MLKECACGGIDDQQDDDQEVDDVEEGVVLIWCDHIQLLL